MIYHLLVCYILRLHSISPDFIPLAQIPVHILPMVCGGPQCITCAISGQSMPIPKAVVATMIRRLVSHFTNSCRISSLALSELALVYKVIIRGYLRIFGYPAGKVI